MRLLLAAVVFIVSVFVITSLIVAVLPPDLSEWFTVVVVLVAVVVSLYLTNKFVNIPGTRFLGRPNAVETAEQLEQDGMLVVTQFRAKRAFQVEEKEHEGSHYFLELHNGAVLYLTGSYLHDFEPIEVDNEIMQKREFPCTKFTVRRRSDDGSVVDMECGGSVLEPEAVTPPFDNRTGTAMPKDGDIISDRTYDELKAERSGQTAP